MWAEQWALGRLPGAVGSPASAEADAAGREPADGGISPVGDPAVVHRALTRRQAMEHLTLAEAARRAGVTPATLRRWAGHGVLTGFDGEWTPVLASQARIVARMRERGHSLEEIARAARAGQLAFGYVEDLFPERGTKHSLAEAAAQTGMEPALIERIFTNLGFGFGPTAAREFSDDDIQLLRYVGAVLAAGFPLVALLQLIRVYGQALSRMADAEVRLFHLYVHEPLMRSGVPGLTIAEEMEGLARELLPLSSPIMDQIHQRFLGHFVEQDVIGHMETDLEDDEIEYGRMRVAIAFADLAGYTRLTEEAGEEEALGAVERFVEAVELTLPDEARIVKTIGDEVMVVGSDPTALIDWAVGFQMLMVERPLPRIGIHVGGALFRDGDYYGREVNLASRVAARAAGGEVLVTRPVVEAGGPNLEFAPIGQVRLKGFTEPTELFLARLAED